MLHYTDMLVLVYQETTRLLHDTNMLVYVAVGVVSDSESLFGAREDLTASSGAQYSANREWS